MSILGVVLAIFIAGQSVLGKPQNSIPDGKPRPPPLHKFSITSSMVDFTVDLSTNHLGRGNSVFSPFSLASVLNLLLLGAADNTYDQLRTALRHPDDIEDLLIHQQSGLQLKSLQQVTEGSTVNIANRLFAADDLKVESEFQSAARTFYQASVERLDFSGKPAQSQLRVNQWVSNHTNGKIEQLLSEPLPAVTRLVAINVVYFNSSWLTPFNTSRTVTDKFQVNATETVQTNMMAADLSVPYGHFPEHDFSVVGLPYSGGRHTMYVFLPDQVGEEALQRLERHLGAAPLAGIVAALKEKSLFVGLPRFKMSHTLSLSGALQNMGVTDLFSAERAALTRLSPDWPLYLSEVLHQAVIDVHEAGTEAAAATAIIVSRFGFSSGFVANRPFLFIIRDNKTGVPLFWGRLVRPDAST